MPFPRKSISTFQRNLADWFESQKRPLPWRKNKDPYRIWISEIMLQQTTVTAVIPYFERFMQSFPNIKKLANAPIEDVLKNWSGLGYYSRARNLHKSAKILAKTGFPEKYDELIQLPGFGPYTSRAVTSIAFGESVGVLDGNVIRVLSRLLATKTEWWKTSGRNDLQDKVDQLVQGGKPEQLNQALMELGATICTPKSPACLLCPVSKSCQAFKDQSWDEFPLPKPKKEMQIWLWEPALITKKNKVALIKNEYAPFLKNQWLYPGEAKRLKKPPTKFSFKHGITHHQIFVKPDNTKKKSNLKNMQLEWAEKEKLYEWNPSALLKKVIQAEEKKK